MEYPDNLKIPAAGLSIKTYPVLIVVVIFFAFLLSYKVFSCAGEDYSNNGAIVKGVFGLPLDNAVFKGKSYDEIAVYLKGMGINTVIGVPLDEKLITALHARDIKAYAEIGIFAGEEYWIKNPDSRPINSKGEPISKQDWYCGLCPVQGWLRKEKLDTIRRIIRDFDVDGIWLDFIRYPCRWEISKPILEETCFCSACLEKFKADTGINLPPDLEAAKDKAEFIINSYGPDWYSWRCKQITDFVRDVKSVLTEKDPRLQMGLFAVPWREGELDNAIINIIAQDIKKLSYYADIFSPMAYHKMCNRDIGWIGEISQYMRDKTTKRIMPVLQAADLSEEELANAIAKVFSANKEGLIVFDMNTIINDKKEEVLKAAFNRE